MFVATRFKQYNKLSPLQWIFTQVVTRKLSRLVQEVCLNSITLRHSYLGSKRVGLHPQKETTPENLAFHRFKQKTQMKLKAET